jgi:hypothetical protein
MFWHTEAKIRYFPNICVKHTKSSILIDIVVLLINHRRDNGFMYALGHVAFGYIIAWATVRGSRKSLILWAAFTASILPDFDVLLIRVGLGHETYTHTLVTLAPIALVLVLWRKGFFPYIAALLSHLFIDMLIGPVNIFRPFNSLTFTMNLKMSSPIDAALETSFLVAMIILMKLNGDLKRLQEDDQQNILLVIPLIAVTASMLIVASRMGVWSVGKIISLNPYAVPLGIIALGHLVLVSLMTYSLFTSINSIRLHNKSPASS